MGRNVNLIGCTNVRVASNVENFIAIDCHDTEFDSSYSNSTVIKNGSIVITDDGIVQTAANVDSVSKDAAFSTEARYRTYYCDSTATNFDVNLIDFGRSFVFIKTAGVNIITITPATGTIDGGLFVTLTNPIEVFFDGTNWHTK